MHPHILRTARTLAALVILCLSLANPATARQTATSMLQAFHSSLIDRYPSVSHLSTEDLAQMLPENVVLFDVRKQSEYDVSRIEGAIRVSPSVSSSAFMREHAETIKGMTVVFYCSVGERSSRLAERVMSKDTQADAIYNLAGGVFKWHNEHKDVTADGGATTAIHPFNRRWGRLLERQDDIRMKPLIAP